MNMTAREWLDAVATGLGQLFCWTLIPAQENLALEAFAEIRRLTVEVAI